MILVLYIDEFEVRNILLELALKDNSLQNQILTKYVDKISPGQMNRLKQEVEMISIHNVFLPN